MRAGWPRLRRGFRRPLGYCKVCNLEDFAHPDLMGVIRSVFPHDVDRFGRSFPAGAEYRKHWEVAMAARALGDFGALHPRAEILGVAAGNEPTAFWLTTRVRRVFATDLYLDAGIWKEFANPSMLADPAPHWPSAWNPRRLVVQHMNALDLRYEDATFDGVFSSGSIEHFGTFDDVRRSMDEMYRVLKPGGVLTLSTEFRIEGPSPGLPGCLMFDAGEIAEHIVGRRAWRLVSPLNPRVSGATRRTEKSQDDLVADFEAHFARYGQVLHHRLDLRSYPQIVLRLGEHVFTSVHVALRKAGGRRG